MFPLDPTVFLIVLIFLHILDSITTYQGIKSGNAKEGNKFVAKLMTKAGSVKAGLWLAKLPAIYIAWMFPTVGVVPQIFLILMYVITILNNYKIWKK